MFRRVAFAALTAGLLSAGACAPITSYSGFQAIEASPHDVKVGTDTKSTVRSRLGSGAEDVTGTLFVLGALVTLAIATLVFKRAGTGTSLWMSSGIQSLAGGLALLPVALLTEDVGAVHMSTPLVLSFLYLTLGASVGGFSLWFFILKRASATKASALHFLMPPLGLMFGWLVLGETVPPLDLLGIVPIVLGIRLVTTAPQKR